MDGGDPRGPLTLLAVLIAVLSLAVPEVRAHEAIGVIIESPRSGARVKADVEVVLLGQGVLGGVDRTAFGASLDGRVVGSGVVRVGERTTLPLRDLPPGRHRLAIRYRPDVDEAERTQSVTFVVEGGSGPWWPYIVGGAIAVGAAAVLVAMLRHIWRRR